jgi:hypothetical protein
VTILHRSVPIAELDPGLILAPERYDPRRRSVDEAGTPLTEITTVVREQVTTQRAARETRYLVLDTGHAREGVILTSAKPVRATEIGSTKKRVHPGDVIVSRLRPYLRQVAYIDDALAADEDGEREIVCSTEFYVLRAVDAQSIAFLVPFLLSDGVQRILAASQEGGHHPRFDQSTLERLIVPDGVMEESSELSSVVEAAVASVRSGDRSLRRIASGLSRTVA